MSTADVFSSTVSGLFNWMQSKERTRLDARRKGQSVQKNCRLFALNFFFQIQQKGHEQADWTPGIQQKGHEQADEPRWVLRCMRRRPDQVVSLK
ncbi:hypothetical protein TNCV_5001361 [Trichonephila clavipes]|nr:hypothetical protein TNCV_5001361 [Trichonephila clavipes]